MDTHTSYLIMLVTYINAPLSIVLFMSLYRLYMLTTLVFACLVVFPSFCNSLYQLFISYVLMCVCGILLKVYLLTCLLFINNRSNKRTHYKSKKQTSGNVVSSFLCGTV